MGDADTRALRRAAVVLLVASLARWGWERTDTQAAPQGPDLAHALLDSSRVAAEDAERRARPLRPGELVDPNQASEAELDRLPGIGPATARRIVEERELNGPYPDAESLARVRGIGPRSLERLRPHLEVASGRARAPARPTPRIDVNRAAPERLETLPGVGPALARRIVETRALAPFRSVDDLVRVRGIGPATLERLRPLVRVGPGA